MNKLKLVRKIPLVMWFGYKIRAAKHHSRMKQFALQPINNNQILLASTNGAFNDSPRAVAEYVNDHHIDLKLIWVYKNDLQLAEIPDYVIPVKYDTDDYYQALATSHVWFMCYLLPDGIIKKPGQLYIQAWHGDKPFKKIVNDAADDNKEYRRRTFGRRIIEKDICDYTLTGCSFFIPIWRSATGYEGEFINVGLPRNDRLLNIDELNKKALKKVILGKYGIPYETKILLYAPTQRDHRIDTEIIGSNIEIPEILEKAQQHFGGEWYCFVRAHSGNRLELKAGEAQKKRIFDLTSYPDIADLLIISDMLITDYSSCAGDFALTNKPVLLYQDDYEEYTTKDRGLYVDMTDTPFWVAHNMDEAKSLIDEMTDDAIVQNDEEIRRYYGSSESCRATKTIVDLIQSHMK